MAYYFVWPTASSGGTFVSPFYGPNGTAALPTYSFSSDPDTGMYRSAVNTLGWSTNGTLAMSLDANAKLTVVGALTLGGVLTGVAGAVGAPAINLGTANTGLYASAATTLSFATGGVLRAEIDANGLIGLGGAPSSGQRVTVKGSGTTSAEYAFVATNSTGALFFAFRNDGVAEYRGSSFNITGASASIQGTGSGLFTVSNLSSQAGGAIVFPGVNTGAVLFNSATGSLAGNGFTFNATVGITGDIAASGGYQNTCFHEFFNPLTKSLTSQTGTYDYGGVSAVATYIPPKAGSIIGITYYMSGGNKTAGSLVFTVFKNGVATAATITAADATNSGVATFAKDAVTFAAGDTLDIRYTTDANFLPDVTLPCVTYLTVEF